MNIKKTKKYPGRYRALLLAFIALLINFWAWTILSPLASQFGQELNLSPVKLALLLAIPVIIGALGRIPAGVLTDKYGGRLMFTTVSFLTVLPVLALSVVDTYNQFLLPAAMLGLGGATFAIGIPFVNAWFEPSRRGFALGLYSMGNAGTAVSGFLTPQLAENYSRQTAYTVTAISLVFVGILMFVFGHNSPSWKRPSESSWSRLSQVVRLRTTWDLSLLYTVSFGAFVAFGVYLPLLLKISFDLSLSDAAARAGGFILLATIARPIGGWLSDKLGGQKVVRIVFVLIAFLATIIAFQASLTHVTTAAYLTLAFVLGCGNGAVIALISKLSKPDIVGSVTGIVGACGGIGGFLPPLILGVTYQRTNSYTLALLMLAIAAALAFVYINKRFTKMRIN